MDIGPGELIVVLIVVLLIFGSTRLPALGRSLGEAMREVRHWSDDERQRDDPAATGDRQADLDAPQSSTYG
jgi:sec-independent protein translocase protein TatA